MGILKKLFGKPAQNQPDPAEQAVIVTTDRVNMSNFSERFDEISALEDALDQRINDAGVGEFDGNEVGPDDYTLYMYAPDAERLFAAVEDVLRGNGVTQGGKASIRSGPPGSPERVVNL